MTAEIVKSPFAPLPPDEILEANKGDLSYVILIGVDKKGQLALASSESNMEKIVFTIEQIKHKIMMGEL